MSGENILEGFLTYVRSERYELLINWLCANTTASEDKKLYHFMDTITKDAKAFEELENLMEGYIDVFGEEF